MDEVLYRLHAEHEETYWWWVGKNTILLHLIDTFTGPRREHAVDIGCGSGGLLTKLANRYEHVTGVDMSPIAREYCAARGFHAVDGSLPDHLDLPDNSSDLVVLSEVLEHIDDDRGSVLRAARLLRPGGTIACTVPAHRWMWTRHDDLNHHKRRYTLGGFSALFDGLEPLVLSYYNTALFPPLLAMKLLDKLKGQNGVASDHDVPRVPGFVNRALASVFSAERHWLAKGRLPTGASIISVHRKP